jgi:hypothetical protein
LVGLFVYVGLVAVCAILEAKALVMVLPAALVGMVLHVVRGRPWIGLASAILVAGLVGTVAHMFEVPPFDDPPVAQGPQENDEITYKNLTVANVGGYYGGTVELRNHTDVHADTYVRVHVYDGDQDLGELAGVISLKPRSSAILDLQGYDEYRTFTDTVVEVTGIPAIVQ